MPVVRLNGLSVRFRDDEALRGVDLSFLPQEIHALLGPNGAGKSTMFKAILDAVPYEGEIRKIPAGLRMGHLIEHPAFYAKLTLLDNLSLHASYLGVEQGEVEEVLSLVELEDRSGMRFAAASLGMRQRLGIARALLGEPQLLLLDEPTSGLDPLGIRHCRELLRRIRDDRGTSIVVASHHLAEVSEIADRVTFLRRGEVVFESTHAGPFVLTPADGDPCAVATSAGAQCVSPHDTSSAEASRVLDLDDLYAALMEGDQT